MKNFDLRMALVKMFINAGVSMNLWYSALCRKEHPSDVAKR